MFDVAKLVELDASIKISDPFLGQEVLKASISGVDDDDKDGDPEVDFGVTVLGKTVKGKVEIPVSVFRGVVTGLLTPVLRQARKLLGAG